MTALLGISNASARTVTDSLSPTPTMGSTLLGWFRPIALARVVKVMEDHELREVERPLVTRGVVQPFSATQLSIKPEGERAWKWWMIHATPDLVLLADEVISYRGTRLRIMRQFPYEANGFVQYEAVEAYAN